LRLLGSFLAPFDSSVTLFHMMATAPMRRRPYANCTHVDSQPARKPMLTRRPCER
jgi:hypothetical protein